MRIVSQDGYNDFPYDLSTLSVRGKQIDCGYGRYGCLMATYSTHEKALKAMDTLHLTYVEEDKKTCFQFPQDSEVDKNYWDIGECCVPEYCPECGQIIIEPIAERKKREKALSELNKLCHRINLEEKRKNNENTDKG